MDVIGHNIANVNTIGYKSSRATFAEAFSQSLSGASPANADTGRGGTNPMQIGLGVNLASIDKIMTQGAAQRTDNPFDLMIQGEGFFIVGDSSGQYFTRAGALTFDAAGNLVTSTGMNVLGWNATAGEGELVKGVVQPIVVGPDKDYIAPSATSAVQFQGNLNAAKNTTDPHPMMMTVYDSIGNRYVIDLIVEYKPATLGSSAVGTPGDPNYQPAIPARAVAGWDVSMLNTAYPNGDRKNGIGFTLSAGVLEFSDTPVSQLPEPAPLKIGEMTFSTNGDIPNFAPDAIAGGATSLLPNSTQQFALRIDAEKAPGRVIPGSEFGSTTTVAGNVSVANAVIFNFAGLTQYGGNASSDALPEWNGYPAGTLNGISVGTDGSVMGRYSNGRVIPLAKIPVAFFKNPAGLQKVGDSLYVPTANSGEFNGVGNDITEKGGSILGGVLEMSNVDLSAEFVEMITTQRGFQANSRTISTSDELLQELIHLKR
jgi:flagellar hook protein FlgE